MKVSTTMPPITAVPITCRAIAPAPDAVQRGKQPRMNANDLAKCDGAEEKVLKRSL